MTMLLVFLGVLFGLVIFNVPVAFSLAASGIVMMLVGKMWDESTLYTLGDAFEKSGDWKQF